MPFTMSYGVPAVPPAKPAVPAPKKPATPRAARQTARSKAAAQADETAPSEVDAVTTAAEPGIVSPDGV